MPLKKNKPTNQTGSKFLLFIIKIDYKFKSVKTDLYADLARFILENVFSHEYGLPNAEIKNCV